MDKILIEGLTGDAIIGIHPWERKTRQKVVVDLELFADLSRPGNSDDIGDTVSYGDIARLVTAYLAESKHLLIESLAEALATQILAQTQLTRLVIKVSKPGAIANAANVAVVLERARL